MYCAYMRTVHTFLSEHFFSTSSLPPPMEWWWTTMKFLWRSTNYKLYLYRIEPDWLSRIQIFLPRLPLYFALLEEFHVILPFPGNTMHLSNMYAFFQMSVHSTPMQTLGVVQSPHAWPFSGIWTHPYANLFTQVCMQPLMVRVKHNMI